jgi:uncharacterized membrane protein
MWEGPLPPPESLKKFDDIIPNGAERVFRMAEAEQAHRFEFDRSNSELHLRSLDENVADAIRAQNITRLGIWLGWTISLGSVIASLVSVQMGAHWSVSAALVGVPLMSVVRAFILRK